MDAIQELVARSKPHKRLEQFREFHAQHPELFDFLVAEIQTLIDHGHEAFSFASLWNYARWKMFLAKGTNTFKLDDYLLRWYGRAIVIIHDEFNGLAEFRGETDADISFGTRIEGKKAPGVYARRLIWADGMALSEGWRPSIPHVVVHQPGTRPDVHPRAS